jgi:hypothetical protein
LSNNFDRFQTPYHLSTFQDSQDTKLSYITFQDWRKSIDGGKYVINENVDLDESECDETTRLLMKEIHFLTLKATKLEEKVKHYKSVISELQSELVTQKHMRRD